MKYSFTMESENFEQDMASVADIIMGAFERYSKIKRDEDVSEIKAEVHGLDNRIDGLEALLKKGNFNEVNGAKVYGPSDIKK